MMSLDPALAFISILFALFVRWSISLTSFSGAGKGPLFGDYEAQRHWMEITYNLPAEKWYVNGSDNDLMYWGLDYPPLTAYHSLLYGYIASKINTTWVALYDSRGHESYTHKLFMRYSVLAVDLLVYFPAVFVYFYKCSGLVTNKQKVSASLAMLLYPGLMLIDHGHFQYNCVSLGLALWGVIGLCRGNDLLGAAAFGLALNYKQMELYHALPFFCYLLGMCFKGKENWFLKLLKLGAVVIATFAICWMPFLRDWNIFKQVIHRLFPFARGLFEDKVANVWCTLSLVVKLKEHLNLTQLINLCLLTTIIGILPSSIHLLMKPSKARFKLALINSSLVFFLFSFQVHEKSILIAALPVCLLLPEYVFPCLWFLQISTFSMIPLLVKDGHILQFIAASVIFHLLFNLTSKDDFHFYTPELTSKRTDKSGNTHRLSSLKLVFYWLRPLSLLIAILLTVASLSLQPPQKLPHLFPVLISAYACVHFCCFLIYFHWLQFTTADDVKLITDKNSKTVKEQSKRKTKSKIIKKKST